MSLTIYDSACLYYDTSSSMWNTSGCFPNANSDQTITVCDCNHMTMFGASVQYTPVLIDFEDLKVCVFYDFCLKLKVCQIYVEAFCSIDIPTQSRFMEIALKSKIMVCSHYTISRQERNGLYRFVWRCSHCTEREDNTDSHWVL